MASKIKVDTLETADGSGSIALSNQFSGMTTASLPTTGTLPALDGSNLTGVSGGKVLQFKHAQLSSLAGVDTTSTTLVDTGLSISITPTSSASKMVIVNLGGLAYRGSAHPDGKIHINSSLAGGTIVEVARYHFGENDTVTFFYGAAPSTSVEESMSGWTSGAITYKVQIASGNGNNYAYSNWGKASLYVMEIGA